MKTFFAVVVLAAVCNAAVLEVTKQVHYTGIDEGVVKFFEDNHLTTTQKMNILSHMKFPASAQQACGQIGELYGGPGGAAFDDGCGRGGLAKVEIYADTFWSAYIITAMTMTHANGEVTEYGERTGEPNGGDTSPKLRVELGDGEKIVAIIGNVGTYVNKLGLVTMLPDGTANVHGPVGDDHSGDNFIVCSSEITSFRGQAGWAIDAIGVNGV